MESCFYNQSDGGLVSIILVFAKWSKRDINERFKVSYKFLVLPLYPYKIVCVCRFEGQISRKNIEIGIIGADKQFRHALS